MPYEVVRRHIYTKFLENYLINLTSFWIFCCVQDLIHNSFPCPLPPVQIEDAKTFSQIKSVNEMTGEDV